MVRLWIVLLAVNIILTVAALISCLSTEDEQIRALPRMMWVLIVLLFSPAGAIAWFLAGRESTSHRSDKRRPGNRFPGAGRPKPLAPDDDPQFLRRLAEQQRQSRADDATLRHKREEGPRRDEGEPRKKTDETDS